jgi:hypothetical protein
VLVIGAWLELDADQPLRVRLTTEPASEEKAWSPYAASVDDILIRVRSWLDLLMRDDNRDPDSTTA